MCLRELILTSKKAQRRNLLPDCFPFLVNEEATVVGVWSKLENIFMMKTLTNRIYLKFKLYTCKMKEGTSVRKYVNKFDRIISNLKDINVKIDEQTQHSITILRLYNLDLKQILFVIIFVMKLFSYFEHMPTTVGSSLTKNAIIVVLQDLYVFL